MASRLPTADEAARMAKKLSLIKDCLRAYTSGGITADEAAVAIEEISDEIEEILLSD